MAYDHGAYCTEHRRLRAECELLWQEHTALQRRPFDPVEHAAHRTKLRAFRVALEVHRNTLPLAPAQRRFDRDHRALM